ncbi:hypothetical protein [Pseudoduganella dura]|uniref:hypothetical protein n=1 Tax=Pseudoduganella dura TaxID=321982 RepID=UPI001671D920|nr:hypothetical protein [Pseudoduganella dura]GGY21302.1 hypothetical protein GCM10007386_57640 [Pseudoduganella dura]
MKQVEDSKTIDLVDAPGVKRQRGRPVTGTAMTAAERQAARRQRLREAGHVELTVSIPADLAARLDEFLKFKDETKDHAVTRALQAFLRKR